MAEGTTFKQFAREVEESCSKHAQRKGYTRSGIDGPNRLNGIMVTLGVAKEHAIGEIIYKAVEFLQNPRKVLLVKIAGWAFILWREL